MLALPPEAPARTQTFKAAKVRRGVATFRLRGVVAGRIRAARVVGPRGSKRVSVARVRRGIRRGYLRVRIARVRRSPQSRRKATRPRLVIETADPPGSPSRPAPAGSTPLDAAAAARVTPHPESVPANYAANHYMPTSPELTAFHNAVYQSGPDAGRRADAYNPLLKNVTGGFTGTTDEILQWAAYKWSMSPDVLRAVALIESNWNQQTQGDRRDGVDASQYPPQSRIDSDSVYESAGITQIKWRSDGSLNPGTEPLRWKSTAFNADYWGASVRYYYDGLCDWCGSGYAAGQLWESIGAHFDPSPWRNQGQLGYIDRVKGIIAARSWPK
jgi:hypothetical protein